VVSSTANVLPRASSLRTCRVPPIASTSDFDSANPNPVPSIALPSAPSRSNGVNSRASLSAAIPGPVSLTSIRSRLACGAAHTTVTVPPEWLYFTPFDSKFSSTCCSR
jgi:hypothetical protein